MNAPGEFLDYGPDAVLMAALLEVDGLTKAFGGPDIRAIGSGNKNKRPGAMSRLRKFFEGLFAMAQVPGMRPWQVRPSTSAGRACARSRCGGP